MKILVIGLGSIGKRHAKNLLRCGYKDLIFCSQNKNLPIELRKIKRFSKLNLALREKPQVAFICNETALHCKTAVECIKKNCAIFIEKPIGNKLEEIKKLQKMVNNKNVFNMVGYMLRFHPAIIEIKKILKKKYLGRLFYAYSEWGEYLPSWHPKENYRKSYAAKKNGGGCSITLSHDLDLLKWFFGPIKRVNRETIKNSKLKIKAESSSDFLIKFQSGLNAFVHLDFLQTKESRFLKIVGEDGVLTFEYNKNRLIVNKSNRRKKVTIFKKFNRNQMFINEIKYFFKNIKKKQKKKISRFLDINESMDLLTETKII